jgi:hypothetical protein
MAVRLSALRAGRSLPPRKVPGTHFCCQFLFHQLLHTHLSSGAGTIGPLVAGMPNGLILTPPHEQKESVYVRTEENIYVFSPIVSAQDKYRESASSSHHLDSRGKRTHLQSTIFSRYFNDNYCSPCALRCNPLINIINL